MFMHGGDKDQGPTSRSPDRVRINNKLEAVKCGCGAEKKWTRPAERSVQCIALHETGGVMVIADIAVIDQSFIIIQTNKHQQRQRQQQLSSKNHHHRRLLRPHSSACTMGYGWIPVASPSLVKRARWQDPPAHQGPVLPGACAIEKKKREKRERLLAALPALWACRRLLLFSRTRAGARTHWQLVNGRRGWANWLDWASWGRSRRTRKAKNSAPSRLAPLLSQPKIASVNLQQFEWPGNMGPCSPSPPPSPLPAAHQEV